MSDLKPNTVASKIEVVYLGGSTHTIYVELDGEKESFDWGFQVITADGRRSVAVPWSAVARIETELLIDLEEAKAWYEERERVKSRERLDQLNVGRRRGGY